MGALSGGDGVMRRLAEIAEQMGGGRVSVGFMSGATYPDGTPVAAVAASNEYGIPTKHQPPRPFFRNMIAKESHTWGDKLARLAPMGGHTALSLMGEDIAGALKQSINDLTDPPLAARTIAEKGFSKPLIDTSHMVNSVTYVVEDD
jgi:hypothetical protein